MNPIQAVAMDVDGVLTDGTFWLGPAGEEFKRFSFRDVMGVSLAKKSGLVFALISGEATPQVDQIAKKLGISRIYKGCKDKGAALLRFSESEAIPLAAICFIGDDVNDLSAMALAGLAATPGDAHPVARAAASLVAQANGGHGAVREILDHLMGAS